MEYVLGLATQLQHFLFSLPSSNYNVHIGRLKQPPDKAVILAEVLLQMKSNCSIQEKGA